MTIQVLTGPITKGHHAEWVLSSRDWDSCVRFILRCRYCRAVLSDAGWDWIGGDGPPFGVVHRELQKRYAQAQARYGDETCDSQP